MTACATPAERAARVAAEHGYSRLEVTGTAFRHLVFAKPGGGPVTHVYLEHDGAPWLLRTIVSADPTPRHPLMLELMAADPAPAVYLGRPCYFGLAASSECDPRDWTDARYSERVVASLAAALRSALGAARPPLAFIGASGGGTLAVLLAERFPETRGVLTLAGNLDTTAWTLLHGYSPLAGSLDPARRPPPEWLTLEWHYVGTRDQNTPPRLAREYAASRPAARVVEVPGFDHLCCWRDAWPALLAEFASATGDGR